MARVSLIVPVASGSASVVERIDALHRSLTAAGHAAEILVVADPRCPEALDGLVRAFRTMLATAPGKAASAYRGLGEASGDLLVILDLEKGYLPEDLEHVIEPLIDGEADVVIASRNTETPGDSRASTPSLGRFLRPSIRSWIGTVSRPLIGITDPSSGLVAVTRASYEAREKHHTPLGSRFVLELLVGAVGRRVEVPLRRGAPARRVVLHPNDLRLIKRLVDDRFGNLSRLLQFCMVGASGMVIDLGCYAFFQLLLSRTGLVHVRMSFLAKGQSLDLAVAGALAIAVALLWNFSLNRRMTFNDARQGSIVRQFITYVLGNALGIALSFSLRLILPSRIGFFQRHKLAAAVVGIVAATGISFTMSRWVVFSRRTPVRDRRHRPRSNTTTLAEQV